MRIEPGQRVLLLQAAANRDPEVFADPDRFVPDRRPNRHVSFGYSLHYCLGAAIARLEGALGLGAIIERFPEMRLADATLEWDPLVVSRSLKRLPVEV
jgi:cytochrome P450